MWFSIFFENAFVSRAGPPPVLAGCWTGIGGSSAHDASASGQARVHRSLMGVVAAMQSKPSPPETWGACASIASREDHRRATRDERKNARTKQLIACLTAMLTPANRPRRDAATQHCADIRAELTVQVHRKRAGPGARRIFLISSWRAVSATPAQPGLCP